MTRRTDKAAEVVLRDNTRSKAARMRELEQPRLTHRHELVYLEWLDSYGVSANWESTGAVTPAVHSCASVGWVVSETNDVIVVVPHISPEREEIGAEESGCGEMTIPKCSVVCRRELSI